MTGIEQNKDPAGNRFPMKILAIVLVLSMALFIGLGWYTWNSYRQFKMIQGQDFRLQELTGIIIHLDEVLTMSARMAAATGDVQWEERYRSFESKLDGAIKETIQLAPEAYEGESAAQTDAANIQLVKMENQAFALVRQGRHEAASKLLSSTEYEQQKRIYTMGMENISAAIKGRVEAHLHSQRRSVLLAVAAIVIALPALIFSWIGVLRTVGRHLTERRQAEGELASINQRLERSLGELGSLYAALTPVDLSGSTNQMMERVIERLIVATGADAALIRLYDKPTRSFICASQRGFPAYYLERALTLPPGSALDYVFSSGEPIISADIAADPRLKGKIQLQAGFRSCAFLPLKVGKEVRGIVHLASRKVGYFREEKKEHLMAIARQMGIAIENRELFDEISAAREELEKANKVKDEFLGFISHELKTPINSVVGYAAMMQDRILGEINEQQERALGEVVTRSKELLGMINSLLEATKVGAGAVKLKMVEVALGHFLDELRSGYNVSLDKELTLIWDFPPDLPAIMIDSEKLKHILENLINNAIKYTDRGHVTISARYLDGVGARAGSGQQPGDHGHVEFKVADTGIGIPKEEISFIFEMFRQVEGSQRRSSGGVGLGLHIVKTFTEMLGGKIDVESEVGKGSTFTITIPCRQEAIGNRQ